MEFQRTEYLRLMWAKTTPFKSILEHALDTAAMGDALVTEGIFNTVLPELSRWIFEGSSKYLDEIRRLIQYLNSMHDIGKMHPFFEGKEENQDICIKLKSEKIVENYSDDIQRFRHEQYSKSVSERIWKERNRFECNYKYDNTIKNLSKVLGLHHQGKEGKGKEVPEGEARQLWHQQQDIFEDTMFHLFQPPQVIINAETKNVSSICMMLLGIIILSDWLASSDAFIDENLKEKENCEEYYQRIRKKASELVKQSRLLKTELPHEKKFTDIWSAIPRRGMRPLQIVVEQLMMAEKKPILMIIEAPMGEGKTEAGAYAAFRMGEYYGKKGFYVALPTAATANQMHARMNALVDNLFPKEEVRLLHSLAWLVDDVSKTESEIKTEDNVFALEWTKPLRRGLLEGYSVGTIDQVLMAALCVKYGVIRLLGIQNKVLLLDEIHAYDAYMQNILLKLLHWCRALNVPIVMLSATLATETKKEVLSIYDIDYREEQEYPAITSVFPDGTYQVTPVPEVSEAAQKRVRVHLEKILDCLDAISSVAINDVAEGGCLCVLLNTVEKAERLYQIIKERKPKDVELYLIHAQFSEERKKKNEKKVCILFGADKSNRPKKAILIATQIVEQSLDIDFDCMITEIAPIDLLFQRIGRLFRHSATFRPCRWKSPEIFVLIPEDSKGYGLSEVIYPKVFLELTQQYLLEHSRLDCPESIREAVEYVYGNNAISHANMEEWIKQNLEEDLKRSMARNAELSLPDSEEFGIYDRVDIFDDSENRSFLSAKTRLSEPTVRIAIVPRSMLEELEKLETVSKRLAKEIYLKSVSVREKKILAYEKELKNAGMVEGKGLLNHMLIIPGEGGVARISKDIVFDMNDELGFLIRGGEKNGSF